MDLKQFSRQYDHLLHDVSALSGYCKVPGGHLIGFSFLENRVDPYTAKALEDQMVPIIARYSPPS